MAQLVTIPTDSSAHWYDVGGRPMHTVESKSKPGQMRPTTLRDARKLILSPSTTRVLGDIIRKPQLENWKIVQAILSALTLPRNEGESDDAFAQRAVKDSQEESHTARDLGTDVHHAIANWLVNPQVRTPEYLLPFLAAFRMWHDEHVDAVLAVEKQFCRYGYGGTVDLVAFVDGQGAVIDLKTQNGKPDRPLKAWDGWGEQLAAYARGLGYPTARLLNVILDKNQPGRLEVVEHTENKDTLTETFDAALTIWCNRKGYDSRAAWERATANPKENNND